MASNVIPNVFHCSGCHEELNLDSKTLPCLHSFCCSCLDKNFEGETDGNGQCPECHEPLTLEHLRLSPFLVKPLRHRQLEMTVWKCDLCSDDGHESIARNWCLDCQRLFCDHCSKSHQKFQKVFNRKHNMRDLDGMERGMAIKMMTTDMCHLHQKEKDCYCEQCNMCFCDTCYQKHSADSPECLSQPSQSVREEALKQKSQGLTLGKEMSDLEMSLRRLKERMKNYTVELNSDCDSKCKKLWENYVEVMENAKRKTDELCGDLRRLTAEQVKRWQHLLEENENILKQLEIWRINLQHLLNESQQDMDVVCGVRSLGLKLSSQLDKSFPPEEKCQLEVTLPLWWLQVMEDLRSAEIGSASLTVEKLPTKNLTFDKQWKLRGSNYIYSIHVSKDDHVFVCDADNQSVMEFTGCGEFVGECHLFEGTIKFTPWEMCSISTDILMVACGDECKLIILERIKIPPFLKIKKIIHTEKGFFSLCEINKTIFACDYYYDEEDCFQIDCFTTEGEKIKTIDIGELGSVGYPLIRADSSTGNFWVTTIGSSEAFCLNSNGERLRSMKTKETISDFHVNEFSHLYFCNMEGIFSLSVDNILCKFEKKPEAYPSIFISRNKIFVCLKTDGEYFIKIFKIFY